MNDLLKQGQFTKRFGLVLTLIFMISILMLNQGCLNRDGPSPQQQLVTVYDQFNMQYADYMTTTGYSKVTGDWVKVNEPTLTKDQKEVLRKKKRILTDVFPLIQSYDSLIITGGPIPPDLLPEILGLLNRLTIL